MIIIELYHNNDGMYHNNDRMHHNIAALATT